MYIPKNKSREGFLFIEVIYALLLLGIVTSILMYYYTSIVHIQDNAKNRLKATTIALNYLETIQHSIIPENNISVEKKFTVVYELEPFSTYQYKKIKITVSWQSLQGKQAVSFISGALM